MTMLTNLVNLTFQECDQVHIDDVSSDDNGQDLRYLISLNIFSKYLLLFCFGSNVNQIWYLYSNFYN